MREDTQCRPAKSCVCNIIHFQTLIAKRPANLPTFSLLAAIHFFISFHDEITDFCSMDKKTGRRYVLRFPFSTITTICEDILMRNAYMKYFRSETFCGRTHCAVPLRPAFATSYILKSLSRKDPQISHIQICEDILMRNG